MHQGYILLWMGGDELLHMGSSVIGARIVDDNDRIGTPLLVQKRFKGGRDPRLLVVGTDHHAHREPFGCHDASLA
ncbi:hypothetical protein HC776_03510 [bacterium]|nr:hypothetical protein [bacterium]